MIYMKMEILKVISMQSKVLSRESMLNFTQMEM